MAGSNPGVSESEFCMWRAVFAFAFVDNILSIEEQDVLKSYTNQVKFSDHQLETIKVDFKNPPNVVSMHKKITQQKDRERFCVLARTLVWCEGDMDKQEAEILKHVSCIGDNDDEMNILKNSRAHVTGFYQNYAKAGMSGLFKPLHNLEMRV